MHPIHQFIAAHLHVAPTTISDADRLREDLALEPIDLVQIMLDVEARDLGTDEFPVEWIDGATCVGDLVRTYDDWMSERDTATDVLAL